MIHHWKKLLVIGALLLIGTIIYAQIPRGDDDAAPRRDEKTEQILSLVRTLYEEMTAPDAGSTCSVSCAVEVVARGANDSLYTRKSNLRYTSNADRIGVQSAEMSLYQDSSVGVAVIPSTKQIRIFNSSQAELEKVRMESMKTFRDELFAKSSVEKHEVNGAEHRLSLLPVVEFRRSYGIERIEIVLVPDERRIVSIRAEFGRKASYHSMLMQYGDLECTDGSDERSPEEASALAGIFESKGRLRPGYSGYNVVDLRSK